MVSVSEKDSRHGESSAMMKAVVKRARAGGIYLSEMSTPTEAVVVVTSILQYQCSSEPVAVWSIFSILNFLHARFSLLVCMDSSYKFTNLLLC